MKSQLLKLQDCACAALVCISSLRLAVSLSSRCGLGWSSWSIRICVSNDGSYVSYLENENLRNLRPNYINTAVFD